MALLTFTANGIYCPAADVYLDPWLPVKRAMVTHGHSDHARWGNEHYLCTHAALPVIRHRLNLTENIESVAFGEPVVINNVRFTFHPAGHIPGSAQIRVEHNGEVWVFSGDYKLEHDNISEPFEPVRCHTFITESTFGLPVYRWRPQAEVFDEINSWWRRNIEEGKVSVIAGYALGKSQRILRNIDAALGKVFIHGAIEATTDILRAQGIALPPTVRVTPDMKRKDFDGALVICPPSAVGSPWLRKFEPCSVAIASGWMGLRGARRRRGADRGFVLSDHVDWPSLNQAIAETGADQVFVTHGYADIVARWLTDQGKDAHVVKTAYEGELGEMAEATPAAGPDIAGENGASETNPADTQPSNETPNAQ